MNKEVFVQGITDLQEAFNYTMSDGQVKVYWKYLKDATDSSFLKVMEHLILNEHRFPTIASITDCPFFEWEK